MSVLLKYDRSGCILCIFKFDFQKFQLINLAPAIRCKSDKHGKCVKMKPIILLREYDTIRLRTYCS